MPTQSDMAVRPRAVDVQNRFPLCLVRATLIKPGIDGIQLVWGIVPVAEINRVNLPVYLQVQTVEGPAHALVFGIVTFDTGDDGEGKPFGVGPVSEFVQYLHKF